MLRLASGIVLAILAAAMTIARFPVFFLAIAAVALVAAMEWRRLCGLPAGLPGLAWLAAVAAAGPLSVLTGAPAMVAMLLCPGAGLVLFGRLRGCRPALWSGVGLVYVGLPAVAATSLREPNGMIEMFWLAGLVAATDTGAFVGGRLMQGRKLAPAISPGKTWSGALSGLVAALLAAGGLLWHIRGVPPTAFEWALTLSLAILAQIGDLFESAVKRIHNRKDSGSLIPGHGGILDRIDGLLFVLPAGALCFAGGLIATL